MALPLRYRLKRKKDIETVFRSGRRRGGVGFRLFFYPNTEGHARFAFVISKKTARKAVDRNRIRRRITGWIQTENTLLEAPFDIICIVSPHAFTFHRKELYDDLQKHFHLPHHALPNSALPRS